MIDVLTDSDLVELPATAVLAQPEFSAQPAHVANRLPLTIEELPSFGDAPFKEYEELMPEPAALGLMPAGWMRSRRILPLSMTQHDVTLLIDHPDAIEEAQRLCWALQCELYLVRTNTDAMDALLATYLPSMSRFALVGGEYADPVQTLEEAVDFVQGLLETAVYNSAQEIHWGWDVTGNPKLSIWVDGLNRGYNDPTPPVYRTAMRFLKTLALMPDWKKDGYWQGHVYDRWVCMELNYYPDLFTNDEALKTRLT